MRDEMDAAKDRDIAEHVLEMHRYVRPGHENIPETEEVENDESDDKGEMFVKLAGRKGGKILTTAFLKKFVDYAKMKRTVGSSGRFDLGVDGRGVAVPGGDIHGVARENGREDAASDGTHARDADSTEHGACEAAAERACGGGGLRVGEGERGEREGGEGIGGVCAA